MNVNPQQALDDLLRSRSLQHWYGLRGSSRALLLAAVQQRLNRPLLILAESFEKAEQLVEDIAWFLGRDGLWLFPQWDTLPYDNFSPHKEIVGRRMATLHALQAGEVRCLVTTPPAMMQKLMPVDEFLSAHFELRVGVPSKREDLLQQLPEWGYSQVDTVEEQGEFSAHGNLIDLFPVNQAQPVRLGWKKDRLHTLQPFQIETQLTEGELETLLVLPAREVLFSKAHLQQARKQLNQYRDQMSANLLQQMKRRLADGEAFPGMESLLPLFYEKLQTLFDYLPEDIYVVLEESEHVHNRAQHFYNEVFMEYELSVQQENLSVSPETMYLDHRQLESELSQRAKLNVAQARQPEQPDQVLHWRAFACSDNRGLRQGFERAGAASAVGHVINLLQQWRAANTPVFLSAKTQTAADHFRQLLGDLGIEARVAGTELRPESMPWLEWLSGATPPTVGEPLAPLPILVGALSAGFRWLNEQGQPDFALLTEEEVFGEKSKRRRLTRAQVQTLGNSLEDLREGDPVVHLDYGIGRYVGLKKIPVGDSDSDFMVLEYARNEKVYVPVQKFHLVQKYVNADGTSPKLNKLGDKAWTKTRSKVAKSVEDIAGELTEIYAARRARKGFSFPADDHEMQEFELRFPYEETPDQLQVIEAVKADMEAETPMDRLVCGDVGFGKTEIAMRAAFKCANAGKQVAVLVPTTILAQQHFVSFKKRFDGTPFNIEMLSRFRTATEQRDVLKNLRDGKVDILIGTHRLLSQDVKFPQLGLLVVDEEQRFGVKHKEKIKAFRAEVDVLTLSATPIPRTLYMSMTGIRDLSIINTPPADRMAIRTRLLKSNDYIIQEAVSREIRRGGQIYVVHNRVESIFQYGNYLKEILPNVRIGVGHGQMSENQLEQLMMDFMEGQYDVLVATTIIESGLDIPRANTIIINHADQFGLSQLYQLRGRVGRSNVQAYAYLLVPPEKILSNVAQERLKVLQELNDLGAGFKVASRDLELRGAGNLLGSEQSGHIASVGLELYTQMVERAVRKLEAQELVALDDMKVQLSFLEEKIPEEYIKSTSQRLSLYKQLSSVEDEERLWELRSAIENRFGSPPEAVLNLFKEAQVRCWGQKFGVPVIEHKGQKLRIQLLPDTQLQHENLISWLSEANTPLRFQPETTLELTQVPPSLDAILAGLQQFQQRLFLGNSAHA